MFCKKKATLLVAILCVFAVSFVACSKKDAVSSGAATGADGATSQEVTKADKKAEEKKAKAEAKKAKESKKGSSKVKLPTTPNAEEDFIVQLTEDGTGAIVTGYTGKSGAVYVPATIQGLPVKRVNLNLSSDNEVTAIVVSDGCTYFRLPYNNTSSSIKYISLPDSVTKYESLHYSSITEFEVPAGVKVLRELPPTLEKISFRGAPEEISEDAFKNNTNIKTITLPDSIKGIGSKAFENCIALESINLPASLEWIGKGPGPYGWTNNGEATFNGCSNLKEIIIPDSLTSVSFPMYSSAFGGCSSLPLATQARLKQLGYEKSF